MPAAIVFTLAIGLLLAVLFGVVFNTDSDNKEVELNTKVGIGIVGNKDDAYLNMGLEAVKAVDVSKDYMDLILYDSREQAVSDLENEKIMGYLYVPDGFIESVLRGENLSATFVSNNSIIDMAPMIVNDVIDTVSDFVFESQTGIFAMEEFYFENDVKNYRTDINAINIKYISFVVMRNEMVEITEVKAYEQNTVRGYFVCVFFVLIIILTGVLCANICVKRNMSLSRLLKSKGCGSAAQTVIDFLTFAMIPVFILLLIIVAMSLFLPEISSIVPEFFDFSESDFFYMFLQMLPGVFAICAMQYFVYELCNDVVSASLLQFVVSIGLAYISGCLYPISIFPKAVREAVVYLPLGSAFETFQQILLQNHDADMLVLCLIYGIIFISLSALVRNLKIRSRAA